MRKTTRRKGIGGPFKGRAPKVVETKAVETPDEPLPETKEAVIEAMAKLCDEVDVQMAAEVTGEKRIERSFKRFWQQTQPWRGYHDRRDKLTDRLRDLLDDETNLDDYLRNQLADQRIVPSFARPSFFVIWIDFIPVGCSWEGFIAPDAKVWAIDPDRPWINPEGMRWVDDQIGDRDLNVEDVFRNEITGWTTHLSYATRGKKPATPSFQPVSLTPQGRQQAGAMLEGMPWLRPILQRGPVNAIRMPPHIKSVQLALA
jgi:hypothetical protein